MKTESEIETLLRQAPAPAPSPELGGKLKNAVHLPRSANGTDLNLGGAFWRRWLPAIGYAVMVLGCVVVLAVQNHQQSAVVRQLEKLREDVTMKEQQLEQQHEQTRLALAADARIKNLQDNATEADQLAATLAELQALIAKLTAEAADLEAKLAEVPESNEIIAPYDFFNDPDGPMQKAREKEGTQGCIQNLKKIDQACRVWAAKHDHLFPPDLNSIANDLETATVLCCPRDAVSLEMAAALSHSDGRGWSDWPLNGGTYELLGANLNENSPDTGEMVLVRCKIHGHRIRVAGSLMLGHPPSQPQR